MANHGYKPPGFLAIVGGVILFVIMIGLVCSISTTVKVLGYGLLYLPSRLGLLDVPRPEDIQRLDLISTPVDAYFEPGTYEVFTSNYELLSISMQLEDTTSTTWFHVASATTGDPNKVDFVLRGLMPYDTPFAEGRPVLRFTINDPGLYRLSFPTPPATSLYFVPDTTTGKEWLIWLTYLAEVGLILGVPGWFYIRGWRRDAEELAEMRRALRARADSFWEQENARQDIQGPDNTYQDL